MALCLLILVFWGNTLWIHAKAELAQYLIADAWNATLTDQKNHKPWSWADTWPIAELSFPKKSIRYFILEGSNGSALAFSPGHITESAYPEEEGTIVVSGHRDTHFSFLKGIKHGDILELKNRLGKMRRYAITKMDIKDIRDTKLVFSTELDELKLVTCYPFDTAIPGGPLRLIVTAEIISPTAI